MSYLVLPDGIPDFSKAVISLWFRVPQDAIDSVIKYLAIQPNANFEGGLPLIVIGPQLLVDAYTFFTARNIGTLTLWYWDFSTYPFSQIPAGTVPVIASYPTSLGAAEAEPSWLGLSCDGSGNVNFYANIQTSTEPVVEKYEFVPLSVDYPEFLPQGYIGEPGNEPKLLVWPGPNYTTYEDASFYISRGIPARYYGQTSFSVSVDTWHHVLISWDISNPVSVHGIYDPSGNTAAHTTWEGVDSFSKMWLAFDDINRGGYDLPADWIDGAPSQNYILPRIAFEVAGRLYGDPASTDTYPGGIGPPTYNLAKPILPSAPFGIPSSQTHYMYSSALFPFHVEMAEFQMWTGVTLDTSVENNRRAFIDYRRDAKGEQIRDKNGKLTLVPVDPAKAAKLIGRIPDVELHKSSNWIKGNNTGTTGKGPDGKPISTGQFKPTGVIKKYKPDPSIVVA